MKGRGRWAQVTIALAVIAAAAVVTPAIGGQGATTAASKKVTVSKKKLKKLIRTEVSKQIGKATGPPGANGLNGLNGLNGANGTARAYGTVRSHDVSNCLPTCQLVRSKGIRSVTHGAVGEYCVHATGIDSSQVTPAVAVDFSFTEPPRGNASVNSASADPPCGDGGFWVFTQRQPSTTVCTNSTCSTTTQVAGDAVAADDVSFTIVIP